MEQCSQNNLKLLNTICYQADACDADYYFVYDEQTAAEINRTNQALNKAATAFGIGSARIENIYFNYIKSNKMPRKNKLRIMYVLSLLYGNANRSNWTDTQIFRLQQGIVRIFKDFPNIDFIVKGLANSDGAYNPLPDYVRDIDMMNCIYFANGKFLNLINEADVFIFDFYSTAMAEALATDKAIILFNDKNRPLPVNIELLKPRIYLVENNNELAQVLKKAADIINNGKNRNDIYFKQYLIPEFNCGGAASALADFIHRKVNCDKK